MNCFYHQTSPAVGICKSCGKGVCPACAVDLGKGLACKARCEENAQEMIDLIDSNIRRSAFSEQVLTATRQNRYFNSVYMLVLGIVLLGFAAYAALWSGFNLIALYTGVFGTVFLIFGLIALRNAIRLPPVKK